MKIARVVDYSDFLAFMVFPFALLVLGKIDRFTIKTRYLREWSLGIILPVCLFAFVATSQDDPDLYPIEGEGIVSCCQSTPYETSIGNGNIFIPTIFTPDGNGVNDFFQVSADSNILQIDTFLVFETINYDTVFYETNLSEITPVNGFDGTVVDSIFPTSFFYMISISAKDGTQMQFNGFVCSIPCEVPLNLPQPARINECAFSTQHNFVNGYDPTAASGELLNCFD